MSELSPAAQAVIDTWWNASDGEYINGVWTPNRSAQLAAALRAAADQVVPEEVDPADFLDYGVAAEIEQRRTTRAHILAIAAELEAS